MRVGHTPSIAFRHLPPKEGCRKPVLGVCLSVCVEWVAAGEVRNAAGSTELTRAVVFKSR